MKRFAPALALTALLLLAACQDEPSSSTAEIQVNDSASIAVDTGAALPDTTASADSAVAGTTAATTAPATAGAATGGSSQQGGSARQGGGAQQSGIDTTGSGPATIPQGRYTTTSSGLKYYDIEEGNGPSPSGPSDRVRVHYTGWLQSNGEKFDSSYDRGEPIVFPLDGVIRGWTEGLQSMKVGGTRQLVIPADLAYGQRGSGPIPPGSTLVFEVELLGLPGGQS